MRVRIGGDGEEPRTCRSFRLGSLIGEVGDFRASGAELFVF